MTVARYDAVADSYAAAFGSADDPVMQALISLIGQPAALRVLDVACGHGRLTRELANRGADVTGLDISAALIAKARAAERETGTVAGHVITYILADVSTWTPPEPASFDVVTCSFGLSDIDDLAGCAAAVASALRPGGVFVFSILHPCFPGAGDVSGSWPTGGRYYDEGRWFADGARSTLRQHVGASHRMLSTYLNTLREYGLVLEALAEPGPESSWAVERPAAARHPVYLAARCVKQDA